jgi:hypothetical protein
MKPTKLLSTCLIIAALPLAAWAQTTTDNVSMAASPSTYGPHTGSQEFTIGSNGSSNRDLNNSNGGVAASYGYYFTNHWEGLIRQTGSYSNPQGSNGNVWNGGTSLALDYDVIGAGALRPFVGANVGWDYGSNVRSTAAAGLEGGAKFYVMPRTFIFAMADYGWFFRHDKAIASRISTGLWNWSVGVGFNF